MAEIYEGDDGVQRLAELGLDAEILRETLIRAHEAAQDYRSKDDAKNAAGMVWWARAVGFLRRELSKKGWGCDDPYNLPIAVGPKNDLAVTVMSGDSDAGIRCGKPKTRYPKGEGTSKIVGQSEDAVQGVLFDANGDISPMDIPNVELAEGISKAVEEEQSQNRQIWLLLYYHNQGEKIVQAELSRPAETEAGKQIDVWRERIIIEPVKLKREDDIGD